MTHRGRAVLRQIRTLLARAYRDAPLMQRIFPDDGLRIPRNRARVWGSRWSGRLVNGKHVTVIPSQFVRAGVEDTAAVTDDQGNESIDLRFDDDGTAIVESSIAQVAEAG